ncbi:hypothetical protein REH65_01595 [Saccharopolyspora sp. ID03-671]|uniref:hypothetical protein n=1 Tax=Saccharopolyspora sp. ID03-671 TaxID=3073066 RepID=UPI00324E1736
MGQLPVDSTDQVNTGGQVAPAESANPVGQVSPVDEVPAAPQAGEFRTAASQQQFDRAPFDQAPFDPPQFDQPSQGSLPPRPSTAMSQGTTFAEALDPGGYPSRSPEAGQDSIAGDTAFQAFYADEPASMPSIPPSPQPPVSQPPTAQPGMPPQPPMGGGPEVAGLPLAPPPVPEHVEVTQPYIPAIRDEQPEFAKRLNPEVSAASPAALTGPQPAVGGKPAAAPRKRGLMRRVVRRIIGPDLLRKDPPKKRR